MEHDEETGDDILNMDHVSSPEVSQRRMHEESKEHTQVADSSLHRYKNASIDYPSFGTKTEESKNYTNENSIVSKEREDHPSVQEECQKYLSYLVEKYDQLDDKKEVEMLILDVNKINNQMSRVPQSFINKFNIFQHK